VVDTGRKHERRARQHRDLRIWGYIKKMRLVELTPAKRVCWQCVKGEDEWVGTSRSFELLAGDREALLRVRSEVKDQLSQQLGDSEMTLLMFAQEN
jgi:hypothetical protein